MLTIDRVPFGRGEDMSAERVVCRVAAEPICIVARKG